MRWVSLATVFNLLAFGFSAYPQQAKVLKAGGRRALIELPSGSSLKAGQTIQVGGSRDHGVSTQSRENIVGGGAHISSIRKSGGSSSSTNTRIAVSGQYGWNKKMYEYGPLATLAYTSGSGPATTAISVGGFYDYNLTPNQPGIGMLYGVGGTAELGFSKGGGSTSNTFEVFAGGNVKWWPLGTNVAVRGDIGLDYTRNSAKQTITGVGVLAKGGFQIYF